MTIPALEHPTAMTWSRLISGFASWAAIGNVRTMQRAAVWSEWTRCTNCCQRIDDSELCGGTLASAGDLKTSTVTCSRAATLGPRIQAFGYLRGGPDGGGCRCSLTIL